MLQNMVARILAFGLLATVTQAMFLMESVLVKLEFKRAELEL